VLFPPFRSGTAHVVIFRAIFPDLTIPRWTQKCRNGTDGTAESGNQNGCGERKLSHVMLHARWAGICRRSMADISCRGRRLDRAPSNHCWVGCGECPAPEALAPCDASSSGR
jgi:hypothetical protein